MVFCLIFFLAVRAPGNHITDGFSLGQGYYEFTLPIVEMQLARAGVRLAGVLNKVAAAVGVPASVLAAALTQQ